MPFPGRISFFIKTIKSLAFPSAIRLYLKILLIRFKRDRMRSVCLKFDSVYSGFPCGVNQLFRDIYIMMMITGKFGNNKNRMTVAHHSFTYLKFIFIFSVKIYIFLHKYLLPL